MMRMSENLKMARAGGTGQKKMVLWILLLMICSLFYSSCSRRHEEESEVTLRFVGGAFPLYDRIRKDLARGFEELHPNVRVRYEATSGSDYWVKIQTLIAGGTAPDVFIAFSAADLINLANKGALLDLTPYAESDKNFSQDEYFPVLIDAFTHKGRFYGLPSGFTPEVLYYNKDAFDEAGLEYPDDDWTWETFLETAQKLTKRDEKGKIIRFGTSVQLYPRYWLLFIQQNGGSFLNVDKTRCIINSPEALEAVKFIHSLYSKYQVVPGYREPGEQASDYRLFASGRSCMFIGGRWLTVTFRQKKDLRWGIAQLPKKKVRITILDYMGWVVSSQTKHPQLAWEFVKYLAGEEGQRYIVEVGDSVPILKSMANSPEFLHDPEHPEEDNEVYLRAIPTAQTEKPLLIPGIALREVDNIMKIEFDKLTVGKQTPEDTLENIEKRVNQMIRAVSDHH